MKRESLRQQGIGIAPFPVSPSGGKPGRRRLRCATARRLRRPKAERSSAFWAGKERSFFHWGSAPFTLFWTLCCKADRSCVNKTGHLDLLATDVLHYVGSAQSKDRVTALFQVA